MAVDVEQFAGREGAARRLETATGGWTMSSDPKGLEGSRPNGGLGRCSAFVGVCPDVGKASVVLHAVANRTHRPVLDRLVGCALIEIPVDRNHPDPAFRGTAFPRSEERRSGEEGRS